MMALAARTGAGALLRRLTSGLPVRADMEAMQRAFDTAEEFVLRTAGGAPARLMAGGRKIRPREGGRS